MTLNTVLGYRAPRVVFMYSYPRGSRPDKPLMLKTAGNLTQPATTTEAVVYKYPDLALRGGQNLYP